ncbi:LapA family protein [Calothrix sp. PCC 7507]|uniref:LapA family protein n=1 Tax=Calothrix sp. PCC 7507 TaxID=99598 RepID=UPI00029F362D|nr:LapA family protein [Calothrix sp. PCC 7507]AFY33439.1 hypothetical protein Cal7507_3026 [Calothrix sp. PCC 7507]
MAVIRLILLVAVLGGLTLLLAQNWSPLLSLNFLGIQTQPLPLAIWMLFSTAAGAFTSVFITTLFKLSNYFVGTQRQNRFKSTATPPRTNTTRREEPTPAAPSPPPASKKEYSSSEAFDDWNTDSSNDDWDFEPKPQETSTPKQSAQEFPDSQTYERQQEPKSSSGSGSVYSYNYREPKNTAVGKTESIYDADYRVIIPPYQPPTNNQADEDDDWGFFNDEEDSEDEDKRSRR